MSQQATDQIFDILNQDEDAKRLLRELNQISVKYDASEQDYAHARELILMLAIYKNKEAMEIMSNEVYETIQKRGNKSEISNRV